MPRPYATLIPATIVALALVACEDDTQTPPFSSPTFPTMTIAFTNDAGEQVELLVEIADTPEEIARGLMFRESLPEDHGMLFKYESEANRSFWMKDTTIPLSIAFISANGVIIEILDMEPLSTTPRSPGAPFLTTVEANQGWFAENGVEVGSRVEVSSGSRSMIEPDPTNATCAERVTPTPPVREFLCVELPIPSN